jgi:nitronate monooxygenase
LRLRRGHPVSIRTALTERLGIKHPVLLAPMAGVSGGALAAAVTRAGGLGLIGAGYSDEAWLREQLALAGDMPVGVGFITWVIEQRPALFEVALEYKLPAVFLSFGSLAPYASRIRASGAVLIAQVQTVAQAREAVEQGAQIVVAQGTEAGGHSGARATLPLVPAVIDAVAPIPVIAAGGIADGRGLAAMLCLGAAGVLCGTAFYCSEESLADSRAKDVVLAASGDATQRSAVFDRARGLEWPEPWALRTLENSFSRQWAGDLEGLLRHLGPEQRRYAAARNTGDFDVAAVIAGEAVDLVHAVAPAGRIVADLVAGATAELRRAHALLSGEH